MTKEVVKISWLRFLGNVLIIAGLILLLAIFLPIGLQRARFELVTNDLVPQEMIKPEEQMTSETEPVNRQFSLLIPKIGVNEPVFAQVDSTNQDEYIPLLKKGVAHAKGTSLPNEPGPVLIFAHSADNIINIGQYNAVFFLLNVLTKDDEIFVYHEGEKYTYLVDQKVVATPLGVSKAVADRSGDFLVLQTCWPPGTTFKRLLVFAQPVEN